MSSMRSARVVLVLVFQCVFLTNAAFAHPASGIVVDAQGPVFFVYTNHGVMRIEPSGKLTNIHDVKGGHWLTASRVTNPTSAGSQINLRGSAPIPTDIST